MPVRRIVAIAIDLSVPLRHHQGVFAGIDRYARDNPHWECIPDPFVRTLRKGPGKTGYDGVIARQTTELAKLAAGAGVPVVNVWSGTPVMGCPSVFPDYVRCGRMAAEHLLQRGFRQFAFLGFKRQRGSALALTGFREVLAASAMSCSAQIVSPRVDESGRLWEEYMANLERWVGHWKPPVGVFVMLDNYCRHLVSVCRNVGLRIPDDVAIIGFGNEPLICAQPEPSLSSVSSDFERVGYEAAALLDRIMDGEQPPQEPILVDAAELIVRRSTDVYLVDDPVIAAALRFVAAHSHEGIHVADVARHAHLTVRTMERRFKAATGRTVSDEIARLRLERAKRLLVESKEPIKYLAFACGFSDAAYFHRVFLRFEGMTPRAYRELRRGNLFPPAGKQGLGSDRKEV